MRGLCAVLLVCWLLVLTVIAEAAKNSSPAAAAARTHYNETLAKRLLFLSAGAYAISSPEPCIKRTLPINQKFVLSYFHNYTCDHLDNTCAYYITVSEVSREVIVVFRGTKSRKQLLTEGWDSMQPTVDFYGAGRVNKYFFFALNTMWDPIESTLKDPKYANFSVTFTGHSLGGALASLASIRTVLDQLRRSDQVTLYTFGQPRVGDHQFAMRHDELVPTSYRVVNQLDIVPHLPACAKNEHDLRYVDSASKPCDPQATGVAYHHGVEIWYPTGMGPSNRYIECVGEPKDEDMDCSNSVLFELANYGRYIWDHRHYFGHKVVGLGKLGCNPDTHIEDTVAVEAVPLGATPAGKAGRGDSSEAPKKPSGVENVLLSLGQLIGIHRQSGGRAIQS